MMQLSDGFWERFARRFVPESIVESGDVPRRRAELTVQTVLVLLLWGPAFGSLFYVVFDSVFGGLVCAIATVGVAASLPILRWTGDTSVAGNVMLVSNWVAIVLLAAITGGLEGPPLTWAAILPLFAVLFAGRRSGLAWLIATIATAAGFFAVERQSDGVVQILSPVEWDFLQLLALSGLSLLVYVGLRLKDELQEWLVGRLRESKNQALQANRAKSEFLARASHELRTPLTSILGYAQMLRTRLDRSETAGAPEAGSRPAAPLHEDLDRIERAANNLLELVDDVLDLSKLEAGRLQPVWRRIDLSGFVDRLTDEVAPMAERRDNELVVEVEAAGDMETDPAKLRQILLNLASNACRFTDHGTVALRVWRETDDHQGATMVVFEVADTGVGMSARELDEVFDTFAQADPSSTRGQSGTGLGLSIVEQFVDLLGGEVTVESTPGEGTTFRVHLPDRKPRAARVD
jgi:signal transduction histidine kinase